jgi:hypothetical protein
MGKTANPNYPKVVRPEMGNKSFNYLKRHDKFDLTGFGNTLDARIHQAMVRYITRRYHSKIIFLPKTGTARNG